MRYAQANECSYVWIDQECILQDDPLDVERHLQIMHRVYRESYRTVAILSCTISGSLMSDIRIVLQEDPADFAKEYYSVKAAVKNNHRLYRVQTALERIASDRWFTRAWTFQEKHCASSVELLVPIVTADDDRYFNLQTFLLGDDLRMDLMRLQSYLALLKRAKSDHSYLPEGRILSSFEFFSPRSLARLFSTLEMCQNLIVSDRIAILANVCNFRYRQQSTLLNDHKYSYVTCILVLLMANMFPDEEERYREYLSPRLKMNVTLQAALHWGIIQIDIPEFIPVEHKITSADRARRFKEQTGLGSRFDNLRRAWRKHVNRLLSNS